MAGYTVRQELQANHNQIDLPLQLRKAATWRHDSNRQTTAPPAGMHFAQPEPHTPLSFSRLQLSIPKIGFKPAHLLRSSVIPRLKSKSWSVSAHRFSGLWFRSGFHFPGFCESSFRRTRSAFVAAFLTDGQ